MPKHEFGILPHNPPPEKRYDAYEPQKYNCICIDDIFIEPLLADLQDLPCYWHTRQQPGKGLAYFGITLIPPASIGAMLAAIAKHTEMGYSSLIQLLCQAEAEGKYIIHFGI